MTEIEVKLPGFGLPLQDGPEWHGTKSSEGPNGRFPHAISDFFAISGITLREKRMFAIVNELTDKPRWWEKVHDETIVANWRREACGGGDESAYNHNLLSSKCFDYCLAALRDKAEYFREHGVIHVLDCLATVVKKDMDAEDTFCADLSRAVAPLENVPKHKKDWHPGSNGLVLDLVHPSLFPLKYGLTRALPKGKVDLATCMRYTGQGIVIPVPDVVANEAEISRSQSWSNDANLKPWGSYQWLPSDIVFDQDGKPKIDSYINNLHPQHDIQLYNLLTTAVDKAIPLWEECLSWWHDRICIGAENCGFADYVMPDDLAASKAAVEAKQEERAKAKREEEEAKASSTGVVTSTGVQIAESADTSADEDDVDDIDDQLQEEYYDIMDQFSDWLNNFPDERKIRQPDPPAEYKPFAERIADAKETRLNLRRGDKFPQGLQVIFKLANIHLTPEQPRYDGSNWHVEGALNEHICATALFYYDQDNIEDSMLEFRCQVDAEEMIAKPQQSENIACEDLFGVDQEGVAVQELGHVLTRPRRILAFPNVMQHRVGAFGLKDASKPGHRKILAMFLVDPHVRILSTANVPPQRVDWWGEVVGQDPVMNKLPAEVFHHVLSEVDNFPISWEQALNMREELMEERGRQQDAYEKTMQEDTFYFCEH